MDKNKQKPEFIGVNFPKLEEEILSFWQEKSIFEKSIEKNKEKEFIFFEGPPTANGKPGIHHVLARAFKDLIPRYKTMQGFRVNRKAGWDTQGLPVELEIEKKLGISGKPDIEKYGIEKFNKKCKESVWEYKDEWEKMTERIAFWVDLKNPYVTYDNGYIETLWWIIKQIWDKELLYRDYKVVPYCSRCGTSLSSHELAQGYKENTEDPSVFIKFKVKGKKDNEYFLVWTTTPWTLPSNVALAVGEKVDYVKVEHHKEILILAEARLGVLRGNYKVIKKIKGKDLVNLEYEPLYNFVQHKEKSHYVLPADFVSVDDGTGIVHTAVMYGVDDFELGKEYNLPKHHLIDLEGKFTEEAGSFAGLFVKTADPRIVSDLKDRGLMYWAETIKHTYPFCWRCNTPLLYYAKDSWFIKMTAVRDQLIKNNQAINWVPNHIKEGRFGEWINEVKDWALSRERYWGTPLPIWECDKCVHRICIGSYEELAKYSGKKLPKSFDPHRPFIDKVTFKCEKCDGEMKRVPEVLDAWFDSGSMPYAQWHYPFENKNFIDANEAFPADYISEAIDQTRGWFYTLLAVSTLLGKGAPYKNVICLGLILDKKGQKMSKSKGNTVNPMEIINKYGVDALRWYLYTMNQPGESKNFDEIGVNEVVKKQLLILWNVVVFFKTFAKEGMPEKKILSKHIMDHWILARMHKLVGEVTDSLDKYQITEAGRKIESFVQDLSTWYVRRSRDRFKQPKDSADRMVALETLKEVLLTLTKILAPFMPFIAETLYQELKSVLNKDKYEWKESVHLEDWPAKDKAPVDQGLIEEMQRIRDIAELAHSARAEAKIKVRQPLSQLVIASEFKEEFSDILQDELNVKEVTKLHQKHDGKLPGGSDWIKKDETEIKISLDITLTDELVEEGILREIVRQINSVRKKAGLTIQDRIAVYYQTDSEYLKKFFEFFESNLLKETLAISVQEYDKKKKAKFEKVVNVNGKLITVGIEKKS
ncbi:MAG: isoleucine--tRNA ligase [Patescibacteria group bacterium]